MSRAGALQLAIAAGFPVGALAHFYYVAENGLWYHGKAPDWAPWFWYTLCAVDFVVPLIVWLWPRAGLLLACAVMATTVTVNLRWFPKFEDGLNLVLLSLIGFAVFVWWASPHVWVRRGWSRTRRVG